MEPSLKELSTASKEGAPSGQGVNSQKTPELGAGKQAERTH